jgi:hypothetical protein
MEPDNAFAQTYGVGLLYDQPPTIDRQRLTDRMKHWCGDHVKLPDGADSSAALLFFHTGHQITLKDGSIPAQTVILQTDKPAKSDLWDAALQQSWNWPDAKPVVARCRWMLDVRDMMSSGLPYRERIELFQNALAAVVETIPCRALYWWHSQQFIEPTGYLAARKAQRDNLMLGALNVRLFNITDRSPGENLMDTLGLAALGLPDIQCHFRALDPNEVARVLFNTAYYLFEKGDVIESGHTIAGLDSDDKWICQHEISLADPSRPIIDLNPGQPYAAGDRS